MGPDVPRCKAGLAMMGAGSGMTGGTIKANRSSEDAGSVDAMAADAPPGEAGIPEAAAAGD